MSTLPTNDSSWIRSLRYVPFAGTVSKQGWKNANGEDYNADGFLLVRTDDREYAHAIPSWCVGLLCAAKSKGRAYGKLVRGKYASAKLDK